MRIAAELRDVMATPEVFPITVRWIFGQESFGNRVGNAVKEAQFFQPNRIRGFAAANRNRSDHRKRQV